MAPRVDNKYRNEITKARVELQNLMENHNAWDLLRLAYASQFSIANFQHADAGSSTSTDTGNNTSTDATTKKTESDNNNLKPVNGTSTSADVTTKNTQSANNNFKTEIGNSISTNATTKNTQSAINNLKTEIKKIKRNYFKITYPDLYQLAGVVALETLGGPGIVFVPGREDSTISPDEGCLPDASVKGPSDLRAIFHRVGISNSDLIVALCGGLKLARRADAETLKFDNSYFKKLNKVELPAEAIDKALLADPEFRNHVLLYATDEDAFKRNYVVAHKKLSELGLMHSSFFGSAFENSTLRLKNMPVTQRAVGVAVAAAVVIFSLFYLINRKLSELGLLHSSAFENSTLRLKNMPVTQRAVGVAVAAAVVIFSVFYLILVCFYKVNRRIK